MPLPRIATPTYELVLPSSNRKIKYRPFLVKEEKLLVLALETEDTKQISTAIKTVLKNCIQTRGVKVENLPTFDIEYLFLNIRGKSVGEEVEVNLIAPDDEVTEVPVTVNIDQSFDLIASCIDKIYNEEEVWSTADCTKKEVKDFLEQMNSMQFKEIEKFFETMPKLSHNVTFTNPKTKVESTVVLEGLSSFFA